jgi:tRNA pseudouridine13 synthase
LLSVPKIDKALGIEVYATKTSGISGLIRESVDDFVVEEILVDGSRASASGTIPARVLGSSSQRQRFLLCILVKRNWDTFIAIKNIAKDLCIDQGRVQIAGIKDAKAVTAQFITLDNVSIEEVEKVNVKDLTLYPIGYLREQMGLFYLLGNSFTITITNISKPELDIQDCLTQANKELEVLGGIPNFFGHQRFGTIRPITHLVGKALSLGNFEEAAMLFLAKSSMYEHPESRKARQQLEVTRNFKLAVEIFPKSLRFERIMLFHLAEKSSDFLGAFQKLPLKLQALFVQANQSYLFNRFLSERLKRNLPLDAAVVGDLVVGVEKSGLPLTMVNKVVTPETLDVVNSQVKVGKLRVALPIFGTKQKLSLGVMGEIEREVLDTEGIGDKPIRLNELSNAGGKGGLRAVLAPVREFKMQRVTDDVAKVSFILNRGCYATVVLRELIKPIDPIGAGF